MKPVWWLGDSRERMREFPRTVQKSAGQELQAIQEGDEPADWKPMKDVGAGVKELRVRDAAGAFRVMYVAKFEEAVVVLHCFQKKTQQTPERDMRLAANRLKEFLRERKP